MAIAEPGKSRASNQNYNCETKQALQRNGICRPAQGPPPQQAAATFRSQTTSPVLHPSLGLRGDSFRRRIYVTNFEWRACGRVGGGVGGHCLALPSPKWFETEGGRTAGGHGMQEKAPFTLCEKRSECTSILKRRFQQFQQ